MKDHGSGPSNRGSVMNGRGSGLTNMDSIMKGHGSGGLVNRGLGTSVVISGNMSGKPGGSFPSLAKYGVRSQLP